MMKLGTILILLTQVSLLKATSNEITDYTLLADPEADTNMDTSVNDTEPSTEIYYHVPSLDEGEKGPQQPVQVAGLELQSIACNLLSITNDALTFKLYAMGPTEWHKSLTTECNWNLLHEAVFTDNVEVARLLINKFEFDPNAWDPQFGNCAYLVSSEAMVDLLAETTDFSISKPCLYYKDPLDSAKQRGNLAIYKLYPDTSGGRFYVYLAQLRLSQENAPTIQFVKEKSNMYDYAVEQVNAIDATKRISRTRGGGTCYKYQPSAKIEVVYKGQKGRDFGGLTYDFVGSMISEMLDGGRVFEERFGYSAIKEDAPLEEVEFLGFLVGVSIFNECPLKLSLEPVVFELLAGKDPEREINFVSLARTTDEEMHKFLLNARAFKPEDYPALGIPAHEGDSLRPWKYYKPHVINAESIPDHIKATAKSHLYGERASVFQRFLRGVSNAIDYKELGKHLSAREISNILQGSAKDYSAKEIFENVNYTRSSIGDYPQYMEWLKEIIDELTPDQRMKFLKFFTALERVPFFGIKNITPKFQFDVLEVCSFLEKKYEDPDDTLPRAATCSNRLYFCQFSSKEIMKTRLIAAIENCGGFFLI